MPMYDVGMYLLVECDADGLMAGCQLVRRWKLRLVDVGWVWSEKRGRGCTVCLSVLRVYASVHRYNIVSVCVHCTLHLHAGENSWIMEANI